MSFIAGRTQSDGLPILLYDDANGRVAALGAASVQITLPSGVTLVTLSASGNCWIKFGTASNPPVAVAGAANNDYLPAGAKWTRMISANGVIAVIRDGTATGFLAVLPALDPDAPVSAVAPPGLLDGMSATAQTGYSLRRLRSAYAGPAVQVRRSSDNALQNIGFTTSGDFDVASFNTFVGAGTGFVATWYDQVGTANATAVGGLAANQPQITLAVTSTGKPVVTFGATNIGLIATAPQCPANASFLGVTNRTGNFASYNVFFGYDGNSPAITYANSANAGFTAGVVNVGVNTPVAASDAAFHSLLGTMAAGANWQAIADNGTPSTGTWTFATTPTQLDIGAVPSFGYIGNMAEAIIWSAVLLTADLAALHASHQAYYGTP